MSNSLDRICTVDISLASPISNDANFDNILILGPAPANPTGDVPAIGVYNSLEELTALGIAATGERTDPVGVAARVAFSQSPRPHEVYVAFMGDIVDKETEDPALQTVSAVLENALAVNGWYCICPVGLEDEKVKEVIQWTETQNKLCGYIDKDPEKPIVETGLYLRSFPFFPKETADQLENDIPAENLYGMAVAAAVKAMNYHAGQETWALMPLATVSPAKLTSTFIKKLEAANFNYVITVASKNITQGGKTGGGEWIDVIRFRDWLQNDMQVRVVNLLIVNPKIPYTDNGIGLVENQMLASLKDGQKYGGIAPTEYDADGNAIPGYTTSVPLAADLTSAQKASRILKDCNWCRRVVVQGKYLGEYASDQISRGGQLAVWLEEPFEDDKTCYMLDLDKFLAGFKQWLENCYANCDVVDSTDGSVDCGQIDATCADEIVQHALFGDLVFG